MALPASGPISMSMVATEFSASQTTNMSLLGFGGELSTPVTSDIFLAASFYGQSSLTSFNYNRNSQEEYEEAVKPFTNRIGAINKEIELLMDEDGNFKDIESLYKKNNIDFKLFNFDEKIFEYISMSNLAITRSGASALSELAFLQVPFIAIPYPYAKDNHQFENAIFFQNMNYGWIFDQTKLKKKELFNFLENIIENNSEYLDKKRSIMDYRNQNLWNKINNKLKEIINEN